MSPELAKKLIEKGVIRYNTEINAKYKGLDIAGAPLTNSEGILTITAVKEKNGEITFETRDTRDGIFRRIQCDDVLLIDGMDPSRFAGIYGLTETGIKVTEGKRRGRKPNASKAAKSES